MKTSNARLIQVPERGTLDVAAADWLPLSRSATFWNLVEKGILTVEYRRGGRVRLNGNCYVGRSTVSDDLLIEVCEKVPQSLIALLGFASGADFRIERITGPRSEIGPLFAILVETFIDSVRAYASRGRQFRYEARPMTGSLIGGRLNVTKTANLWARGLRHIAAFEKNFVSFIVPVNGVILSALREVEALSRVIDLPSGLVARARAMAMLFSDCRTVDVLMGERRKSAEKAEQLSADASDRDISDLLGLAALILAHESFDTGDTLGRMAPRSWFLNLEMLFERAVRRTIMGTLDGTRAVEQGRRAARPRIFANFAQAFRASPDLVILEPATQSLCIGDVKYKQLLGLPGASDVYQLLVHASAYKADRAFLVYPSEYFSVQELGESTTGASVSIYGLNVHELSQHVALMLDSLGVHPERGPDRQRTL